MSVDIKSNRNKREFCVSTIPQEKSKEGCSRMYSESLHGTTTKGPGNWVRMLASTDVVL